MHVTRQQEWDFHRRDNRTKSPIVKESRHLKNCTFMKPTKCKNACPTSYLGNPNHFLLTEPCSTESTHYHISSYKPISNLTRGEALKHPPFRQDTAYPEAMRHGLSRSNWSRDHRVIRHQRTQEIGIFSTCGIQWQPQRQRELQLVALLRLLRPALRRRWWRRPACCQTSEITSESSCIYWEITTPIHRITMR